MPQKEQVKQKDIFNTASSFVETAKKKRFYVSGHTNVCCALRKREMADYIPEKLFSLTCDELKSSFTNSDTL